MLKYSSNLKIHYCENKLINNKGFLNTYDYYITGNCTKSNELKSRKIFNESQIINIKNDNFEVEIFKIISNYYVLAKLFSSELKAFGIKFICLKLDFNIFNDIMKNEIIDQGRINNSKFTLFFDGNKNIIMNIDNSDPRFRQIKKNFSLIEKENLNKNNLVCYNKWSEGNVYMSTLDGKQYLSLGNNIDLYMRFNIRNFYKFRYSYQSILYTHLSDFNVNTPFNKKSITLCIEFDSKLKKLINSLNPIEFYYELLDSYYYKIKVIQNYNHRGIYIKNLNIKSILYYEKLLINKILTDDLQDYDDSNKIGIISFLSLICNKDSFPKDKLFYNNYKDAILSLYKNSLNQLGSNRRKEYMKETIILNPNIKNYWIDLFGIDIEKELSIC